MSTKRLLVLFGILSMVALLLAACAGTPGAQGEPGPAGPPGPAGEAGPAGPPGDMADLTCTECHNDTSLISGIHAAWETSLHGEGAAASYAGGRGGCAGCHSGGAFQKMVAAGQTPAEYEAGDPNPSSQDCRTCHQVHTTFTSADWALETTDPVTIYAFEGVTYDGGKGNLCANCHQPRRGIDEPTDGMIEVTSTHWGPHHGPQSAMLLGLAGAGEVEGSASGHASLVEDTCVTCHVGDQYTHNFAPSVAACQGCHDGLEDFDLNGVQTEVEGMLEELEAALMAEGMWDEEGHPVVGNYEAAKASALWNYIFIAVEDSSSGVHNPAYTKALLEASLAAFE